MRAFKTEGIIIKRRDFRDADRILTVFTKQYGKIQVKAAGIRRIPSRRSPHVELLNHAVLTLYKGNAFPVLTEAQAIEHYAPIKNDLSKIGFAYHICELIDKLCPDNQENSQIFFQLKNILNRLSATNSGSDYSFPAGVLSLRDAAKNDKQIDNDMFGIIYDFEMRLLSTLGYLPADRQGWNGADGLSQKFDTQSFIENLIERKLKSRNLFAKLQ